MRQRAYIRPMTRTITVAALQLPLPGPVEPNIEAVSALVEEAAAKGAQVILPPELFEGPYFCQVEDEELFATARPTRSEEHTSELQSLMRISYAVFCLKTNNTTHTNTAYTTILKYLPSHSHIH